MACDIYLILASTLCSILSFNAREKKILILKTISKMITRQTSQQVCTKFHVVIMTNLYGKIKAIDQHSQTMTKGSYIHDLNSFWRSVVFFSESGYSPYEVSVKNIVVVKITSQDGVKKSSAIQNSSHLSLVFA